MSDKRDKLVADIPFAKNKAIEYYADRIIFNKKEIYYDDITGYGYSLSSLTQSVNFIPIFNSKAVSLSISVGNDKKPIVFKRSLVMPMAFHTKGQADLDVIFSEVIKVTAAVLAQSVFDKLCYRIRAGEVIKIGGLTLEKSSLRKSGTFREKELEQYGRTYVKAGKVFVEDVNGKQFFSTALGNINAPLLGSLLDTFYKQ